MDIMEETAGSRVIISVNTIGGTRRDLSNDMLLKIKIVLEEIREDLKKVENVFMADYTVKQRLVGKGVLSKEDAYKLGTVGPMARASGIRQDHRTTGYAAYGELDFEPVVFQDGDCYARTAVRIQEIYQSIGLIEQAIDKLPKWRNKCTCKRQPHRRSYYEGLEQPRGEVLYYLRANGTKNLERMRVRDADLCKYTCTASNASGLRACRRTCTDTYN